MKRILSLAIAMLLLLPSAVIAQPLIALPQKEEVVYGKMNPSGYVEEVIIVNAFLGQGRELFDYGNYSEVLNLTDTGVLRHGFTEVYAETDAQDFFYQGKVRNNLMPWNVTFRYELDGKVFSPEALKGQSGNLVICVKVRQNEEVNPLFYENYMLQISMNFDQKYFSNIESEGATIASSGETKVVNLTSLPGKEADFIIQAKAKDAHLGQIQIAGLPFELFMELPDISQYTGDLTQLQNAIAMIAGGVSEYVGGVGQLSDAADQLEGGIGELYDNLGAIKGGMEQLHAGREQFDEGLRQYSEGMQEFKGGMDQLVEGIEQFSSGIDQLREGSQGLAQGLQTLASEGDKLVAGSQQILAGFEAMDALMSFPLNDAEVELLLSILQTFSASFDQFAQTVDATDFDTFIALLNDALTRFESSMARMDEIAAALDSDVIKANLDISGSSNTQLEATLSYVEHYRQKLYSETAELRAIHASLNGLKPLVQGMIDSLSILRDEYEVVRGLISRLNTTIQAFNPEELSQLKEGIQVFSAAYGEFHNGLEMYVGGVKQAAIGAEALDKEGVAQLQAGAGEFAGESEKISSGVNQLAEGSQTLSDSHAQLMAGDRELISGMGQYEQGMGLLFSGFGSFSRGIGELAGGGNQLRSGANTLRNETSNMSEQMKAKIEEAMGDFIPGEYELVSFADERNTGIQKVQFVYLTQAQSPEETVEEVVVEEPEKSFWDKFLDIFH